MVTLLVITYKAEQRLPEQLSEFYDGLFAVLLTRHDQSKPGFVRKRQSGLNDRQMRYVFEALCFMMRKLGKSPPTTGQGYDLAKKSLGIHKYDADAEGFITDIKKITCLIIEEGGRLFFIHKSVAEYYSACFVMNRPRQVSEKFYNHIREGNWGYWRQELIFLSQIDRYRYCKYLVVPEYLKIFGDRDGNLRPDWREHARKVITDLLSSMRLHMFGTNKHAESIGYGMKDGRSEWVEYELQMRGFHKVLTLIPWPIDKLMKSLKSDKDIARGQHGAKPEPRMTIVFTVADGLNVLSPTQRKMFTDSASALLEIAYATYSEAAEFVRREDESSVLFDDLESIVKNNSDY